jgi:hypothetical protein
VSGFSRTPVSGRTLGVRLKADTTFRLKADTTWSGLASTCAARHADACEGAPATARSSSAMSIFFMPSIAVMARCAFGDS